MNNRPSRSNIVEEILAYISDGQPLPLDKSVDLISSDSVIDVLVDVEERSWIRSMGTSGMTGLEIALYLEGMVTSPGLVFLKVPRASE